jgi:hypothetical protein
MKGLSFAFAVLLAVVAQARDYRVEGPFDGLIEISIPTDFRQMSAAERAIKYPREDRPSVVFTNAEGSFDVTFSRKPGRVSVTQIDAVRQRLSKGLHASQPLASWHSDNVVEINGREFAQVQFTTSAADARIRNVMLATPADGSMLLISINMPEARVADWMAVATEMLGSIHVTKP